MSYDVIVVGLGAMGSAALYQLAKLGVKVLGIDQFAPPHQLGSTHGETRITRLAVGEGAAYMPLVRRSHEIWRDLEAETGVDLLHQGGGLIVCPQGGGAGFHGPGDFALKSAELAQAYDIEHEMLSADALAAKMPQLQIQPHEHAFFEKSGGVVRPEAAVATQLKLARALGAEVRLNEKMVAYEAGPGGVKITTDQDSYQAGKIILSAGAWIAKLLPKLRQKPFGVYRQVFFWFEPENVEDFNLQRFPWLIWVGKELSDYFSLFPILPGAKPALKLMTEQYVDVTDPDEVIREVSRAEIDHMRDYFVAQRLRGITGRCIDANVCLYTMTPDEHFLIDWHPDQPNVLIASPCSGHGFKHSAAIGEALAQTVTAGASEIELSFFGFEERGVFAAHSTSLRAG